MPIRETAYDIVTNAANTIANSTAEAAFFNSVTWRANADANSRSQHRRLQWKGFYGAMAGSPGTLTFRVRWGASAFTNPSAATLIAASGAIALPASAVGQLFTLDIDLTIRQRGTGTAGKVVAIGRAMLNNGAALIVDQLPVVGSDASIGLDTTAAAIIAVTAQFSVADVANTITLTDPSTIVYE